MKNAFTKLRAKMLVNPKTKAAYDALEAEYAVARALIEARVRAGLSQGEIASRMGTTQSAVARLESGRRLPSMKTVFRYAAAAGARAKIRIEAASGPAARRGAPRGKAAG